MSRTLAKLALQDVDPVKYPHVYAYFKLLVEMEEFCDQLEASIPIPPLFGEKAEAR